MILRALGASAVGRIRGEVRLTGLGLGVHVVHGDNEQGKSTLLLALARALFDRHGAGGAALEALRPEGTALAPRIVAELEAGGRRYRLDKQFLSAPHSRLDEWDGEAFVPAAAGDAADERVRALLDARPALKGASELRHWGLARLLWLQQGPARLDLPAAGDLAGRLTALAGAGALTPEEERLCERVEELYAECWTDKGRQRKDSPVDQRERVAAAARERALSLERQRDEAEECRSQVALLHGQLETIAQERDERERALAGLSAERARVHGLREELRLAEANRDRADGAWSAAHERREALAAQVASLAALDAALPLRAAEAAAATQDLRAAAVRFASADQDLEGARAGAAQAARALELSRLRAEEQGLVRELGELRAAEARLRELSSSVLEAQAELHAIRAPDEVELEQAIRLEAAVREGEVELRARALRVDLVAERDLSAEVEGEARAVAAGERASFIGGRELQLRIEGVGTFTVRSGSSDLFERTEQEVRRCKDRLASLLAAFGVSEVTALRGRREAHALGRARLLQLEARLQELGGELGMPGAPALDPGRDLGRRLRRVSERLEGVRAALGPDEAAGALPPAAAATAARAAESALRAAQEAFTRAGTAHAAAAQAAALADHALATAERDRGLRAAERARLEELGGLLEAQQQRCAELSRERHAALDLHRALLAQLPPAAADPDARADELRQQLRALEAQGRELHDRRTRAQVLLDRAGEQGLYSLLARAEEELAQATSALAQARSEADARLRLRTLVLAQRRALAQSVAGPIEQAVTARFARLTGTERRLALDPALTPTTVGGLQPERLSAGAQEQLALAFRLSLGEHLARAEPQLVVLDDALVNTDERRHGRALQLLEELAGKLQILVLTAFPERYRALRGAVFHRFAPDRELGVPVAAPLAAGGRGPLLPSREGGGDRLDPHWTAG